MPGTVDPMAERVPRVRWITSKTRSDQQSVRRVLRMRRRRRHLRRRMRVCVWLDTPVVLVMLVPLDRTKTRLVRIIVRPALRMRRRPRHRCRLMRVCVWLDIKLKPVDLLVEHVFGVTNSVDGQEEVGITETSGMPQMKRACMDVSQMKILRGMRNDTQTCGFGQTEDIRCLISKQVSQHQAPVSGPIVLMLQNVTG